MKKLIVVAMFLSACGGSGSSVPVECTNMCIDMCNKMLVCGMLPIGASCEAERIQNCEDESERNNCGPSECNQLRGVSISASCQQLWQLM